MFFLTKVAKVFTDEEKLKINQFLDKVDADYDRKQKECKHLEQW